MSQHPLGLSLEGLSRLGGLLAGLDRLAAILEVPIDPDPTSPGLSFDRFRLVRRLGAGRFGIVLLADDPDLRRQVVLKVPQPAVLTDPAARERFVREARSAARLDHPGIVPIHEAGESDGLPYLVAGYVAGPTLAAWLRRRPGPIPPATAARIAMKLAAALQHAHERGVLHCDLSPSNVLLVDPDGGNPDPVVTDFGLARLLEDDPTLTRTVQIAGTPQYMAPEQARGDRRNLTARADVYALGAILYELFVGRLPFASDSTEQVLYDVIHTPPRPIGSTCPNVPRDLEAVCLKCLEKETTNRYPSAGALAEDLGRFLDGTSTVARPVGAVVRGWRVVRRRPVAAGLVALATLAVCAVPAVATWYSLRLEESAVARRQAERDAERDRVLAETREFFASLERIRVRRLEQQPGWVVDNLADIRTLALLSPAASHPADLRSEAVAAMTAVDLKPVRSIAEGFKAYFPAYSPDGLTLALAGWEELPGGQGSVRLYDPANGRLKRELTFPLDPDWARRREKPDGCRTVAFSPDGRWLVAGTRGGQLVRWDLTHSDSKPVLWAAHTGDDLGDPNKLSRVFVRAIAFTADGKTMYTSSKERSQQWAAGTDWRAIGPGEPYLIPIGTPVLAGKLTGKLQGTGPTEQTVQIDPKTGSAERFPVFTGDYFATSSDGRLTACATGPNHTLCLLADDLTYPPVPLRSPGRTDRFTADYLGFAPGNGLLVSSEEPEKRIRLWDVASGELVADRVVSGGSARFAFSPDGRHLAVTELDKTVVYEITGRERETLAVSSRRYVRTFAASADGKQLVVISQGDSRFIEQTTWDSTTDKIPDLHALRYHDHWISETPAADYHPTHAEFVYATSESNYHAPDVTGERIESGTTTIVRCDSVTDLRFDPAGRLWLVEPNRLHAWEVSTRPKWREVCVLENDAESQDAGMVYRAVAPGRRVAVLGRRDGRVFVLEELKPQPIPRNVFDSGVTALALADGEDRALVGGERGELIELTLADGTVRVVPNAHADAVRSVAYGPGGWFASGSADRTVRLWDPSGRLVLTLRNGSGIRKLSISKDGHLLTVLLDNERAVRRWRLDRLGSTIANMGIPLGIPESNGDR